MASCFHPLKGFKVGIHPSGKPEYKIFSYDVDYIDFDGIRWNGHSAIIPKTFGRPVVDESIDIPCGKCIGCRLQYSRDWANRCMIEKKYHRSSYFLTLTYNDDYLPDSEIVDVRTGEIVQSPVHTLRKRDFQLFMKRLRKNTGQDLRFFGCGEYGSETFRPHYHIIVFGLELNDLKIHKMNFRGEIYYRSKMIEKCWPYGFSTVCDVSWDTCAYVARYVTKKLNGVAAGSYDLLNIERPFALMSRRPGIAKQFYDENKQQIYKYDSIQISTVKGGRKFKPPRYYDRLYDIDYPSDMELIKANRRLVAENVESSVNGRTDLTKSERLYVEEQNLLDRLGFIKERNKI